MPEYFDLDRAPTLPAAGRTVFTVRLTAGDTTVGIRELRHLLKRLLRQGGLRCIGIHEETAGDPDGAPTYSAEIIYPRRRADRESGQRWLVFHCPRCGRRHRHGWPINEAAPIHRAAACHGASGYWLQPDSSLAKRIEPQLQEAARKRMSDGGKKGKAGNGKVSPIGETLSDDPYRDSRTDALIAETAKAGLASVARYNYVEKHGNEQTIADTTPREPQVKAAAREKQREAGKTHGRGKDNSFSPTGENLSDPRTIDILAETAGASPATVARYNTTTPRERQKG